MSAIALSMEIPTSMVEEWTPLSDLDFVIATTVLEEKNKDYTNFLAHRPVGRELILDNAFHELGYPLEVNDLREAGRRCKADFIISPDVVGDIDFNLHQYEVAKKTLSPEFKIAVVMTGSHPNGTWAKRENFLKGVQDAEMLCCTFKEPERLEWYLTSVIAKHWKRVHLLGVSELIELCAWSNLAKEDERSWSVDTGKCLKWALKGKCFDDLSTLRSDAAATTSGKASTLSQKILTLRREDISKEQEVLFSRNVQILRECL